MRIQVGDPSIDWLELKPQSDDKEVLLVEGESIKSVGMTSEEIILTKIEEGQALRRSQLLKSVSMGDRTAETIVLRETFHPQSYVDICDDHKISTIYQAGKVIGEKQLASGEVIPIEAKFEAPVFDSHSIEMVLRLLPLADDYIAELPVFHAVRGTEILVKVKALGIEKVFDSKRLVDAWKVQTDWDGVIQYYWIGIENRDLVKQVSILGEGAQLEFVRI